MQTDVSYKQNVPCKQVQPHHTAERERAVRRIVSSMPFPADTFSSGLIDSFTDKNDLSTCKTPPNANKHQACGQEIERGRTCSASSAATSFALSPDVHSSSRCRPSCLMASISASAAARILATSAWLCTTGEEAAGGQGGGRADGEQTTTNSTRKVGALFRRADCPRRGSRAISSLGYGLRSKNLRATFIKNTE